MRAADRQSTGPLRVLLCDDHAVFVEALEFVLDRAGYSVVRTISHPAQAMAVLRRGVVDVCVLDLVYGGSGEPTGGDSVFNLMPELRRTAPDTRFLLLTGFRSPDLNAAARSAGFTGVVNKHCRVAEILSAIERVGRGDPVALPPVPARAGRPASRLTEAQRMANYLTQREREVLGHLVTGADTTTLARTMGVSWTTARSHVQSVLSKLGAHSRLEAATAAVRHGVVDGETGRWLL